MIDITIYVEGVRSENPAVSTVDNSAVFRENFHKLFSQQLSPQEFDLKIMTIGSITRTRETLEKMERRGTNGVLLIDLDAPKEKREERLNRYKPRDREKIFLMIQEMEAWIISQVDKIEAFANNEGWTRKRGDEAIADNPLIRGRHPEEIDKPGQTLDTILRQYFDVVKIRKGRTRTKGKRYSKAKDGSRLIGLLELKILMQQFDEVERLVNHIKNYRI